MSAGVFSQEALTAARKWLVENELINPGSEPGYVVVWNYYLMATGRDPQMGCRKVDAMQGLRTEFFRGKPREATREGVIELRRFISQRGAAFLTAKQLRRSRKVEITQAPVAAAAKPQRPLRQRLSSANTNKFLASAEWKRLRYDALKLHGRRCVCCGGTPETGAVMNVDHILPRKTHPHLALDINNLQILCSDCNAGKGNRDSTDWRPTASFPH